MSKSGLRAPVVTEKSVRALSQNKYVFYVSPHLNKIQISRLVQATYSVQVSSVNVMNVKGKVLSRGRLSGKRPDRRKAIVTLKPGYEISSVKSLLVG